MRRYRKCNIFLYITAGGFLLKYNSYGFLRLNKPYFLLRFQLVQKCDGFEYNTVCPKYTNSMSNISAFC